MLTKEKKRFFANIALITGELSTGKLQEGAIVVKEDEILSYGYRKKIISDEYEISAIQNAIIKAPKNILNALIFTSYLPNIEDFKILISAGFHSLFFLGELNNSETAKFLNKNKALMSLEIIRLE